MSSLLRISNDQSNMLAEKAFKMQFELDQEMANTYTERQRRLMYEDILYNLSYLDVAVKFDDEKIFIEYTKWLYKLLCNLSKSSEDPRLQTHHRLKEHFQILAKVSSDTDSADASKRRVTIINKGIETLGKELHQEQAKLYQNNDQYQAIRKEYLNYLIKSDTRAAISLVRDLSKSDITIDDVFQKILQEVMIEVGDLWHQNVMSVDKEHYCTSTTQTALSQFYPIIFEQPRNGCKILTCCVGSELHEMGIRMLSDLFEYHGWDSIYLGAAVPKEAILKSISENKPDFIGLSVTMPQHLELCHDIVLGIQEKFPDLKVAVGGRAFISTNELWKKWNVDISTQNATQLIEWAKENIVLKKGRQ
ncbi:MAG: cobalamin B12-binding domain-containing [Erysipelotrichaceae bacterium]|nr:MAG: cobalamin B12-binding domain-containing [Erysipelotrichaceae bacterium]